MSDDYRIMYVCGNCSENYPEGCGHYRASDLRVMPDGTWLCDGCYDDTKAGDYGLQASEDDGLPCWSDLPKPPEYVPVTAIAAQVKELGPMAEGYLCVRQGGCVSPVACDGFGYCRERNVDGAPDDERENARRKHQSDQVYADFRKKTGHRKNVKD